MAKFIKQNLGQIQSNNMPTNRLFGTRFEEPVSISEALRLSGADFEVKLQPAAIYPPYFMEKIAKGETFTSQEVESAMLKNVNGTMRLDSNTPLGIVGNSYHVFDHREGFAFIDKLCCGGTDAPIVTSAGVLGIGERIYVCAQYPEPIRLRHKDNDLVNMYAVFTTSHDGSSAVTAMFTPIRVVCQNTLNLALKKCKNKWTSKHTANVGNNFFADDVSKFLGTYDIYRTEFETAMIDLSKVYLSEDEMKTLSLMAVSNDLNRNKYVDIFTSKGFDIEKCKVTREEKKNGKDGISTEIVNNYYLLLNTIKNGVGQTQLEEEKETGLHFYNGVTCFFDNSVEYKSQTEKWDKVMTGEFQKREQLVFDFLRNR